MMKTSGSCFCGEVSFSVDVDPAKSVICHCTDCQRVSGSVFRHTVLVLRDTLVFHSGTVSTFDKVGDSGNVRRQMFCATCGTNIGSIPLEADEAPYASIRVPILDMKDALPPQVQVWHSSHVGWLDALGSLPALDKQA